MSTERLDALINRVKQNFNEQVEFVKNQRLGLVDDYQLHLLFKYLVDMSSVSIIHQDRDLFREVYLMLNLYIGEVALIFRLQNDEQPFNVVCEFDTDILTLNKETNEC